MGSWPSAHRYCLAPQLYSRPDVAHSSPPSRGPAHRPSLSRGPLPVRQSSSGWSVALARLVDKSRPTPVSAAVKAQVLAALPQKGKSKTWTSRNGANWPDWRRSWRSLSAIGIRHQGNRRAARLRWSSRAHGRPHFPVSAPTHVADELRVLWRTKPATSTSRRVPAARLRSPQPPAEFELVCDIMAVMNLHAIGQKAPSLPAAIEKL